MPQHGATLPAARPRAAAAVGQLPGHHASSPALYLAALTVLLSTAAMVMGPTPPGTGVMAPATCAQRSNTLGKTSSDAGNCSTQ